MNVPKFKIGDKVKINDKYGLKDRYFYMVFEVVSEPKLVNGNECVKLKDMKGIWRTDGLELIDL